MQIQINYDQFAQVHQGIESAGQSLVGVHDDLRGGSSRSQAMEAFRARIEELKRLKTAYETLLENDSKTLYQAVEAFADTDAQQAASYRSSMEKAFDNREEEKQA